MEQRPPAKVALCIYNELAEIEKIIAMLTGFAVAHALPEAEGNLMCLALDEALNNIISYAYVDDVRHWIRVSVEVSNGALRAELVDDGVAFNPLEAPAADLTGDLRDRRVGGVGLHFIRSLLDRVEYFRVDGRNNLRLTKQLSGPTLKRVAGDTRAT